MLKKNKLDIARNKLIEYDNLEKKKKFEINLINKNKA